LSHAIIADARDERALANSGLGRGCHRAPRRLDQSGGIRPWRRWPNCSNSASA
jgi:hypothetical protein